MKVPKNKKVYIKGKVYSEGEELPESLARKLNLEDKLKVTKSKVIDGPTKGTDRV